MGRAHSVRVFPTDPGYKQCCGPLGPCAGAGIESECDPPVQCPGSCYCALLLIMQCLALTYLPTHLQSLTEQRPLRGWEMGHGRGKFWCAGKDGREEAEARVLPGVQQSSTAVVWV